MSGRRNHNSQQNQRGLRGGGDTYFYGQRNKKEKSKGKNRNKNSNPKLNGLSNGQSNGHLNNKSRGRGKGRKKKKYALMAAKYTAFEGLEYKEEDRNDEVIDPKQVCRYWLQGNCTAGPKCRWKHRFVGNKCPHCGERVVPSKQDQHLTKCQKTKVVKNDVQQSRKAECGICKEGVLERGHRFGLLTGCNHAFCLPCIREWRGVLHQKKEATRACPVCRKMTYFIVPCDHMVTDPVRKLQVIERYKNTMSQIRCRHFDRSEECPFGSSCFYQHIRKDGTVDDKKVNLRHVVNADGEVEILRDVNLSEHLFGPE